LAQNLKIDGVNMPTLLYNKRTPREHTAET